MPERTKPIFVLEVAAVIRLLRQVMEEHIRCGDHMVIAFIDLQRLLSKCMIDSIVVLE